MQNRQSGRRRRGSGGNNNPRPMGQAMGGQSASRLEVRVRGNAHQLLEKYKQLARDAHQAGDRVASEYYLQHADHYFRVLNDSRIRQEEMRARRGVFDQFEDEQAGVDGGAEAQTDGNDGERPEQPARTERQEAGGNERQRRWDRRGEQRERAPREQAEPEAAPTQVLELHLSDGEAALVAFGGAPACEEREDEPAAESADEAPKPRRRGRPRKTETAEG